MQTAADNKLQRVPCGHVLVRSLAKLTEPVGVEGDAEVSVTVAVQTEPEFTVTEPGTQLTTVEVGAAAGGVTVTVAGFLRVGGGGDPPNEAGRRLGRVSNSLGLVKTRGSGGGGRRAW